MSHTKLTQQDFAAGLQAERAAIGAFVELLRREQDALVRGALDEVGAQIDNKTRLLFELARLADERSQFLKRQDLSPDRAGMETWLAGHPEAGSLLADWHTLLRSTRTAFDLNQINGSLIEAGLRVNQQAVDALHGSARIGSVYGRDGHTRACVSARQIGAV